MDPYKQYGYSEGCSSSESGWTTYIVSPMEEDGSEGDEHADAAGYANGGYCSAGVGEAESDDSMASDASSGPCYQSKGGGGENVRLKNHEKGNKKSISMSISSSFTKFMSSSKDKKSEDQKRADRKLPAAGSRKRWK
ncbi:Protein SOB FIVE-LIKE 4 [Linum perenne]